MDISSELGVASVDGAAEATVKALSALVMNRCNAAMAVPLSTPNTDTPKWLGELYACGAVGEMVADLERAGKRHAVITGVVEGGDDYVAKEIDEWCRAAQVRRRFRYTNIAQIGRPYPGMMDLYIDETNLYNRMGLYTKQFDWEKMWAIADPVTDEAAIRVKAEEILDTFDIEGGATVETVWDMAKYVVAFEEWVKKEDLGMVASHYDGFAIGRGQIQRSRQTSGKDVRGGQAGLA